MSDHIQKSLWCPVNNNFVGHLDEEAWVAANLMWFFFFPMDLGCLRLKSKTDADDFKSEKVLRVPGNRELKCS